jgi:hypothetical protein
MQVRDAGCTWHVKLQRERENFICNNYPWIQLRCALALRCYIALNKIYSGSEGGNVATPSDANLGYWRKAICRAGGV